MYFYPLFDEGVSCVLEAKKIKYSPVTEKWTIETEAGLFAVSEKELFKDDMSASRRLVELIKEKLSYYEEKMLNLKEEIRIIEEKVHSFLEKNYDES